MTARVFDGAKIRDQVFAELKDEIGRLATDGIRPVSLPKILCDPGRMSFLQRNRKLERFAACLSLVNEIRRLLDNVVLRRERAAKAGLGFTLSVPKDHPPVVRQVGQISCIAEQSANAM